MTDLSHLADIITDARERFTQLLMSHTSRTGVTPQIYQRYLSMQYHLTKGVQRYFMVAAAHQDLAKMRKLRRFLFDFANEEELHYLVAANDLRELGMEILPEPFDVELWHAYFTREVLTRPFVRLGAAAILENLAGTENRPILVDLLKANFLSPKNTKFLVLHMHETLPHGAQILDALAGEALLPAHLDHLAEGARKGAVMYLRMVEWALSPTSLAGLSDKERNLMLTGDESARIAAFSMADLQK